MRVNRRFQRPTASRSGRELPCACRPSSPSRRGYVLIAVLIVIAVLSLAAYRYSAMMLAEYRATNRISKNAEVKAIADSGIHYSAAILSDPTAMSTIGSNPLITRQPNYFQATSLAARGSSASSRPPIRRTPAAAPYRIITASWMKAAN